ncbi:uncharacterized protein Z518_00222 [Rhinocladiella mackenziei CBS 650.93]|uniref:Uncharacterized protein n=1 Tax=Rhinocladiella mackenziei CBS 650.93 TaxID=1442369 RepID=A0A0D2IT02_9EURO|nr:uncharacterized protein Z518_00222 [Rhinocladiella mackenziei CBS 650.93]KIX09144.1 hypothetical protein Z518_00222 [Rhinocladiella mackenziei CBS 650.93]
MARQRARANETSVPLAQELQARAKANGYKRGAHVEVDKIRNKGKHNGKTIKDQDATLDRYVL